MGWWPFNGTKSHNAQSSEKTNDLKEIADNTKVKSNYSKGQKILLEDTDPRFNNDMSQRQLANSREEANFKRAWESIKMEDFSFARLTMIPCFRDAGLIGFTSMFVVGTVTFLYHKNPIRSANWSVAGLLLGSVVGWEQCRLKRKRSFQVGQMAKDVVASKNKPMLKSVKHDEKLKQQWEGHKNGERKEDNLQENSRAWYKFW